MSDLESLLEIACPRCGALDTGRLGPGAGPHPFRLVCSACGAFIKWLSKRSLAERQARAAFFRKAWYAAQRKEGGR